MWGNELRGRKYYIIMTLHKISVLKWNHKAYDLQSRNYKLLRLTLLFLIVKQFSSPNHFLQSWINIFAFYLSSYPKYFHSLLQSASPTRSFVVSSPYPMSKAALLSASLPLQTTYTPISCSRRRSSPIVVGLIFSTPFPGVTPFKGKSRRRTTPTPPRACSPTTLFTSLFLVSHFLFPEIPNSRCYSISLHLFSFTWFQILPAVAEVELCVSSSRVSSKGVHNRNTSSPSKFSCKGCTNYGSIKKKKQTHSTMSSSFRKFYNIHQ